MTNLVSKVVKNSTAPSVTNSTTTYIVSLIYIG